MTQQELITAIEGAQAIGQTMLRARLIESYRNCLYVHLWIDGRVNHNAHDIWVLSKNEKIVLGRIYLGSKKLKLNTEGWENRIKEITSGGRR